MLIGARTAFVSLGITCQPAWQIRAQQALLQELGGETLISKATPFDWRIAGLGDITAMVAEDEFWPVRRKQLVVERLPDPPGSGAITPKLYWPRRHCLFWHEGQYGHALFSLKQAHLARNFARLADVSHRFFFASNLQRNVALLEDAGLFDGTIRQADAVALWQALERRFGPSVLHLATQPALTDGFDVLQDVGADQSFFVQLPGLPVFLHGPGHNDVTDWTGDTDFWKGVFQRACDDIARV